MIVFWFTMVSTYFLALLARYIPTRFKIGNRSYFKYNIWIAAAVLFILVMISGLRSNIGDTWTYSNEYQQLGSTISSVRNGNDPGFTILELLLRSISLHPQIMIFATALITISLIVFTLYRYALLFELSIFLFITTGSYIVSMNGIRQFLAAAILFVATIWLMKGKWLQYLLAVLLASTFHTSAIIFLPVYFFARDKAWSWKTLLIVAACMLFLVYYQESLPFLTEALSETQYAHYTDSLQGGHGANIIRAVIAAVPLLLAFIYRQHLRKVWPQSDIIVNMSILNFAFMLIAIENWIFARFCIYFSLYNLILFPLLIQVLFIKNARLVAYLSCMVFYFCYFYYEQVYNATTPLKYVSSFFHF